MRGELVINQYYSKHYRALNVGTSSKESWSLIRHITSDTKHQHMKLNYSLEFEVFQDTK